MISGRPKNSKIQWIFMNKLRGTKLQIINVQSELQMCLAQKQKALGAKTSLKQDQIAYIFSDFSLIHTIQQERMEILNRLFNQGLQKWQFLDIKENDPFPKYLFDDGSDLSYIIDYIAQHSQIKTLKEEELFYLHLLCLLNRNQLTKGLLEYYKSNLSLIIKYLNTGIKKIKVKLDQEKEQIKPDDQKYEQQKSFGQKVPKTKQIKKQEKKKNTNPQKNKNKDSYIQITQNTKNNEEQNKFGKNRELAIRSVNYITWAYYYILSQ